MYDYLTYLWDMYFWCIWQKMKDMWFWFYDVLHKLTAGNDLLDGIELCRTTQEKIRE